MTAIIRIILIGNHFLRKMLILAVLNLLLTIYNHALNNLSVLCVNDKARLSSSSESGVQTKGADLLFGSDIKL